MIKLRLKMFITMASIAVMCMLVSGCGELMNGASESADMQITRVFSSPTISVYDNRMDWSPDGQKVAFEGNPMDVYRVAAVEGANPVKVTQYDTVTWDNGGEAVNYLSNGNLAYYVGWFFSPTEDRNMHIMVATPAQVENSPAPTVLHTFNGSDVGLIANSAASPDALSISGDGNRAIISWTTKTYTLDWRSGPLVTALVPDAADAAISRDGARIAYRKADGNIVWRAFGAGAETVVGPGQFASWSLAGKLGYLNANRYIIYDPAAGTSVSYEVPSNVVGLFHAALSWDGKRVAFRTFGGLNNGISVAELK
jgi:hypothetical protein